jgi:hypothetical protein
MALPIRDGNQSLTTLSTILVSNSHIPAHTVVSLGTQAITDIATAVSGVELGPNTINVLENITVTLGQVTITGGLTDTQLRASAVTIGGGIYIADAQVVLGGNAPSEAIQIGGYNLADSKLYPIHVDELGVQTIKGAVTASISGTPSVTFTQASVTFSTAVVTGSTSILNFPATQAVTFTQASVTFSQAPVTFGTAVITGSTSILNFPATQTVTFTTAPVTFGQAIVSASNITGLNNSVGTDGNTPTSTNFIKIGGHQDGANQVEHIVHVSAGGAMKVDASDSTVTFGTAVVTGSTSVLNFPTTQTVTFTQASVTFGLISGTVTANPTGTQTIAGTVTANVSTFGAFGGTLLDYNGANTVLNVGIQKIGNTSLNLVSYFPVEVYVASNPISASNPVPSRILIGTGSGSAVSAGNPMPISGTVTIGASTSQIGSVTASISGTVPISISSVTVGNSVTIGSLPAISGTVTANLSISSTALTSGSFTSLTSATLVPANTARKMATVYNLGAGQLFINAGVSATTLGGGFMVALSSGDFYECNYTTTTLSAIFANAGTASWVSY